MKNLMDIYLNFTEKRIKKYMKTIYSQYYNEEIVGEYLKTYINARYYNIRHAAKPARAFYLRIIDELNYKKDILIKRNEEKTGDRIERAQKLRIINNVNEVFAYILFFDNVRKVENFKKIDSLREIIKKMSEIVSSEFDIKITKDSQEKLYKQITSDLIDADVFLDKFDTDQFYLNIENSEQDENTYFVKLGHNVRMPIQYSDFAITKVFNEGIVGEDKLEVEYTLLSLMALRDIINGEFEDTYIAEFSISLLKKKTKIDSILSIISNQALQAKIHLNINYSDYIKNQNTILEYVSRGYNFAITLDESVKDIEKLKMFKIIIK